jgi:beta-galactosidase
MVTDNNGTIMCLDNSTKVQFTITGNGKIIGPDTIIARGGIASVLVRGNNHAGVITVTATSE